jgi:hypothetical protein
MKTGVTKTQNCQKSYADYIGRTMGKLTVTEQLPTRQVGKSYKVYFLCQCECGTIRAFQADNVISGNSKSCGCLKVQRCKEGIWSKKPGQANAKCVYVNYRNGARKRNIEFLLSFEDFLALSQDLCFYCGSEPSTSGDVTFTKGPKKGQSRCNGAFIYNGLDRLDNSRGYIVDNCVACCSYCNVAKRHYTISEFLAWVGKVYRYQKAIGNVEAVDSCCIERTKVWRET